jgi:hypothetical protein
MFPLSLQLPIMMAVITQLRRRIPNPPNSTTQISWTEVSLCPFLIIRSLTLVHRGAAPYMKQLRQNAQKVWDEYEEGITTVGVAASQGRGLPVYSHSVPNSDSGVPKRKRVEMREGRAENAYGRLGEEVYERPFGGPLQRPGQCVEFATIPPFFPNTLPDPSEVANGKCFQCNQKITTLAMDVEFGDFKPLCGHCTDLAWTATRKHPGLQIVDLVIPTVRQCVAQCLNVLLHLPIPRGLKRMKMKHRSVASRALRTN